MGISKCPQTWTGRQNHGEQPYRLLWKIDRILPFSPQNLGDKTSQPTKNLKQTKPMKTFKEKKKREKIKRYIYGLKRL